MIRFGPAGNSESFYNEGYKNTHEAFKWLEAMGLDAYEYQCGRGVFLKQDTAEKIGDEAKAHGVALSLHAPYYINLAGTDNEKLEKSIGHIEKSIEAARWMGARRVVVHPGGIGGDSRHAAMKRAMRVFVDIMKNMPGSGLISPELMGKINQLGNLDEIIEFCSADDSIIPTLDFGHLNSRENGSLDSPEAYEKVILRLADGIGWDRTRRLHVHFSRIEYTARGGEKRHWTMADKQYGPEFDHLIPVLIKHRMEPVIISESSGTMAEDAALMKRRYFDAIDGN
ncbi:MAG: TIM barrel protein [Clostridia bacterium]|nr:TIM barrel protein [Clostridia bacterium]